MTPLRINGLYAITPDMDDSSNLATMTRQALMGGARLVQYRNKIANSALRLEQARLIAPLCRKFNVPLIVNDHLDLAVEIGADGVHLGQEDAPVTEARRRLGAGKIIGASCYDRLELAVDAERQGADYVAFGAFFASVTKPGAAGAPLNLLRDAKRKLHTAVVAIGGVTPNNAVELIHLGADAVAASNALYSARDVRSAAEKFSRLFKPAKYSIPHNYELSNDLT
ncbi:thiamine-phosphate diphosphorylase [Nitrosospira sp. Nl5]|uniref:thiamine phosphate synthase n=1 Tax=Nitrosospira sp. Nl5 TaxID=200120 RepID=UPI000883C9AA|nr:thiamine phosphate synthase [Nitrosospira sp. Nl5]SCY53020.1 thiamine-phosphate diphosphorylase [Nitrosospira sp. Nl5]